MLDPDHEIRGALGHPDPYIRKWGGEGGPPNFFGVCSKNKGGTAPPPGPSPGSTTAVEEPFQVIGTWDSAPNDKIIFERALGSSLHSSISRLYSAGNCRLRFSGVCAKLVNQLSNPTITNAVQTTY